MGLLGKLASFASKLVLLEYYIILLSLMIISVQIRSNTVIKCFVCCIEEKTYKKQQRCVNNVKQRDK